MLHVPIAKVKLDIAALFTGSLSVEAGLGGLVDGFTDVVLHVTLGDRLLSEPHSRALNPMLVKLGAISRIPDAPYTHDHLNATCLPM